MPNQVRVDTVSFGTVFQSDLPEAWTSQDRIRRRSE